MTCVDFGSFRRAGDGNENVLYGDAIRSWGRGGASGEHRNGPHRKELK